MKLYVLLRKKENSEEENIKKMIVTIDPLKTLTDLKRLIEKEYFYLYPKTKNFICDQIQDEFGYSLTSSNSLENFLKQNDRIYAIYDEKFRKTDSSKKYSSEEIFFVLNSLLENLSKKVSLCDFEKSDQHKISKLLYNIYFLCFSENLECVKDLNIFFKEFSQKANLLEFLRNSDKLKNLTFMVTEFWIRNYLGNNKINFIVIDNIKVFLKIEYVYKRIKKSGLLFLLTKILEDFKNISPYVKKGILDVIKILSFGYQNMKIDHKLERNHKGNHINRNLREKLEEDNRKNNIDIRLNKNYLDQRLTKNYNDQSLSGNYHNNFNTKLKDQNTYGKNDDILSVLSGDNLRNKKISRNNEDILSVFSNDFTGDIYKKKSLNGKRVSFNLKNFKSQKENFDININNNYNMESNTNKKFQFTNLKNVNLQNSKNKKSSKKTLENYINTKNSFVTNIENELKNKSNHNPKVENIYYNDYLELLSPETDQNLKNFAIKNLSKNIEETIFKIIQDKTSSLKLFQIINIESSPFLKKNKKFILKILAENLTPEISKIALKNNMTNVIINNIKIEDDEMKDIYILLLLNLFERSQEEISVNVIFNLLKSDIQKLKIGAAEVFKNLTDNFNIKNSEFFNSQMENKLVEFFDLLKKKYNLQNQFNQEFLFFLISSFSNICLIDYLKPQIFYLEGISLLLNFLRNPDFKIESRRAAMRGLFNLSTKNRDSKVKILSELNYEFDLLRKGTLDPVIKSLLLTLIKTN